MYNEAPRVVFLEWKMSLENVTNFNNCRHLEHLLFFHFRESKGQTFKGLCLDNVETIFTVNETSLKLSNN